MSETKATKWRHRIDGPVQGWPDARRVCCAPSGSQTAPPVVVVDSNVPPLDSCTSGLKGYGLRGPRASQGIRPEHDFSPISNVETSPHTSLVIRKRCPGFVSARRFADNSRLTSFRGRKTRLSALMESNDGAAGISTEAWRSYATICRLCLQKDGFMLGIFNNIHGSDKSIAKKIVDCTALSVCQGDGLPNVICHRCLFKIEFCLEFRQLCFISDATLRQLGGISKENGDEQSNSPQMPLYDQMLNCNEENVVMVVDPNTLDYDSEFESDERQSDTEINELDGKNVSMCKFCDHAFTDKLECSEHEATAHNSACPYNCASCSMNFADRLLYSAHMKSVHKNDKPYNCPQCDRTFARRSDLRKHTIVHTGVKPYTCTVCMKSFSRNTNLSKHMRIHSGTKPFVCPKCPRTFTSRGDLNRHSMIHTGQKPFRCNYCHLSFGRKDKLLRHEKRHWPQQNAKDKSDELEMLRHDLGLADYRNFKAIGAEEYAKGHGDGDKQEKMVINLDPFNHNEFGSETNLQRVSMCESEPKENDLPSVPDHIKDEFKTDDSLLFDATKDQVTGESFSSDGLEKSTTDLEGRSYRCPVCPKAFSTPDNLKYHMARHTGIRPFTCHVCNKSFIRKRELDRHVVTHTGLKPFKCSKCSKSFGRKDKLVRHTRIHDRRDAMGKKFHGNADKIRKPLFFQQQQKQQQNQDPH